MEVIPDDTMPSHEDIDPEEPGEPEAEDETEAETEAQDDATPPTDLKKNP